jgi:hypothetical protein
MYYTIADAYKYLPSPDLARDGVLGSLMNIWTDELYFHQDQLLVAVL